MKKATKRSAFDRPPLRLSGRGRPREIGRQTSGGDGLWVFTLAARKCEAGIYFIISWSYCLYFWGFKNRKENVWKWWVFILDNQRCPTSSQAHSSPLVKQIHVLEKGVLRAESAEWCPQRTASLLSLYATLLSSNLPNHLITGMQVRKFVHVVMREGLLCSLMFFATPCSIICEKPCEKVRNLRLWRRQSMKAVLYHPHCTLQSLSELF